jgi:hypothetical protein
MTLLKVETRVDCHIVSPRRSVDYSGNTCVGLYREPVPIILESCIAHFGQLYRSCWKEDYRTLLRIGLGLKEVLLLVSLP